MLHSHRIWTSSRVACKVIRYRNRIHIIYSVFRMVPDPILTNSKTHTPSGSGNVPSSTAPEDNGLHAASDGVSMSNLTPRKGRQEQSNRNSAGHSESSEKLAVKETRNINILRGLILTLLLLLTTFAAVGVYVFTENDEQEKFKVGFAINANRIIDSFYADI